MSDDYDDDMLRLQTQMAAMDIMIRHIIIAVSDSDERARAKLITLLDGSISTAKATESTEPDSDSIFSNALKSFRGELSTE